MDSMAPLFPSWEKYRVVARSEPAFFLSPGSGPSAVPGDAFPAHFTVETSRKLATLST